MASEQIAGGGGRCPWCGSEGHFIGSGPFGGVNKFTCEDCGIEFNERGDVITDV